MSSEEIAEYIDSQTRMLCTESRTMKTNAQRKMLLNEIMTSIFKKCGLDAESWTRNKGLSEWQRVALNCYCDANGHEYAGDIAMIRGHFAVSLVEITKNKFRLLHMEVSIK